MFKSWLIKWVIKGLGIYFLRENKERGIFNKVYYIVLDIRDILKWELKMFFVFGVWGLVLIFVW